MTVSILKSFGHFRRSLAQLSAAELKDSELGSGQMTLIYFLAAEEAFTAAELTECTQTDRAAVSRALACMEEAGFISREKDPADRRREIIKLTASGKKKAKTVFEIRDRIADQIAQRLSKVEAEQLAKLLEKASAPNP